MKLRFTLVLIFGLVLVGCATSDVNPPEAGTKVGYVDVYSDSSTDLSWEVERSNDGSGSFRRFYVDTRPPSDGILRLALAPGAYRLRISCVNRANTGPVVVGAGVEEGKVTPITITLTERGTGLVERKEASLGATAYGRYGRRTRVRNSEQALYEVSADAGQPIAYNSKEEMPYAVK
jgi:hypothetical protein